MKILIGKVVKPQGIKGEIKISSAIDDPEQFKSVTHFYFGEKRMDVKSIRVSSGFVFALIDGINDRDKAEALRNWEVYADREEIFVPSGSYLIADLVGCQVYLDDGMAVGELTEILQYGTADVFVVHGKKDVQFPFLKDLVQKVDVDAKTIVLKKTRFNEVALYED